MASKVGIGIGVKIDDIKKVKEDLTKQIGNIKGLKANINTIEVDTDKIKSQLESKLKTVSKDLKIKLKGIEIEDSVKQRMTSQIQKALDSLGKNLTLKVKDIELADSLKNKLQTKLNQSLKGVTVKIANVEFDVTKVDTIIKKTREAQKELKELQNVNIKGKSLDIGDGSKSFEELQRRARQIRQEVDSLAKISFTTGKNGGIDKAMITYTDSLGKVVTETMGWKKVTSETEDVVKNVFTTLGTKVNENVDGLRKLAQQMTDTKAKMQGQLDVAKALGMDESIINSLQQKLNNININNFKTNITGLQQEFTKLGVSGNNSIVKLENAIKTLENRVKNIKVANGDIINSKTINDVIKVEDEIKNLKKLLNDTKQGKIIDGQLISREVSTARNSVNQLSSSIREAKSEGSLLGKAFSDIKSYLIGGGVTLFALDSLRDGVKDIVDVDTAMRDLKRVTDDVSENTLNNFSSQANEMAKQLGSTTEEAITATTVWKQMGYTFNEASQYLAKQSMILSNVGDMSSSDASDALVSTMKAFKIEAKDAVTIVDSLNEAGNKFAVTTGDVAEGLRVGASTLALANNDLYQSEALIVAGTEILRDAKSVANGLKTISMRLNEVKNADGETFYKLKNELQNLAGVDLTDVNGNLRSTYDVILDLAEVWNSGKLDDMSKAQLLNDIAGKHQAKVLSAIIQNAEQLPKIYDAMKNSAGSAAEEQARYMDSIEGKMNALKETTKSLWLNTIDSSAVKGLLDVATSVVGAFDSMIKTMGAFPTVTTAVVGGLTLFNSAFRENISIIGQTIPGYNKLQLSLSTNANKFQKQAEEIKKQITLGKSLMVQNQGNATVSRMLGAEIATLSSQYVVATAKSIAFTVATTALQAVLSMGISVAITGVIAGLSALGKWLFSTKSSMNDCSEQAQKLSDSLNVQAEVPKLMEQYKGITEELKNTNLEEERRKELNEELTKVKDKLTGLDSDYKWILDDQNKSYDEQLQLLNLIAERKAKENAKELDKEMSSQGKMNRIVNGGMFEEGLLKNIELYKQIQTALANQDAKAGTVTYNGITVSAQTAQETLSKLKGTITDAYTDVEIYNHQVEQLKDANYTTSRSVVDLDENTKNFLKTLTGTVDESDEAVSKFKTMTSAVNELANKGELSDSTFSNLTKVFPDIGNNIGEATQKVEEFREKMEQNAEVVNSVLAELNNGSISNESLEKLNQIFPELGINGDNAKTVLSGLSTEMQRLSENTDTADESLKKISDTFNFFSSEADVIDKVIEEMNKYGGITDKTYGTLIANHPDVLAALVAEGDTIKNLTNLRDEDIKKMQEQRDEAIRVAVAQSEAKKNIGSDSSSVGEDSSVASKQESDEKKKASDDAYNDSVRKNAQQTTESNKENYDADAENKQNADDNKVDSDANTQDALVDNTSNTVDANGNNYDIDADNKANADSNKLDSDADTQSNIAQNTADTTDNNGENYDIDSDNKANADSNKLDSDSQTQSGIVQNTADAVDANGENYGVDSENKANSDNSKMSSVQTFLSYWDGSIAGIIPALARYYASDRHNLHVETVNKTGILGGFLNYAIKVANKVKGLVGWAVNAINKVKAKMNEVKQGAGDDGTNLGDGGEDIDTSTVDTDVGDPPDVGDVGYTPPPITSSDSGGGGGYTPKKSSAPAIIRNTDSGGSSGSGSKKGSSGSRSSGSRSSGSSSSKKTDAEKAAETAEKFAQKIEDLNADLDIDRYFDANNLLTELESKMTDLKNSQVGLLGADLSKAKRQETEIIKEQIKAYQSLVEVQKGEQEELKATLQAQGFNIDANGKLLNSQQRLKELQDELNARSYDSTEEAYNQKKKDIEALKELQKQVERYADLTLKEIPKATQSWQELSNAMRKTAMDNLTSLRDKLVDGLKKKYEEEKDKELEKIDKTYEKKKEKLEKQYQNDIDSLTKEKEKTIKFYDDQVKELQKQLDALNDTTADKQEKLNKLKQQMSLWQQDDSVFAKKKVEDLQQQIADLEKEMHKDSLSKEIENLNNKKDEKNKYYEDALKDLKDSQDKELEALKKKYDKEKEQAEKKYKELLEDKNIYAEANKLITEKNLEEIYKILEDSAENFKEIGSLLGQNFADSLLNEVQDALNDFRTLTGQPTVDYEWKNGASGDKYAEQIGGFVGQTSTGKAFTFSPDGTIYAPQPLTDEESKEAREIAMKKGFISAFDTGGRTPSTIGNQGALAILHKNEKVLNPEDTKMLDRIYGYVKEANSQMGYMHEAFNQFKQMNDYITGISGIKNTSIKRESMNDNSKQVNLENNFNINNYTKSDSTFSKRELERFAIKQAKLYK